MSAFTFPLGPTVTLPPLISSLPSSTPSMNKSSFPVTSPFIFMPWLMHAPAREVMGALAAVVEFAAFEIPAGAAPAGVVDISATPCGFASSFFHTRHLDLIVGFSKSHSSSAGGDATLNREDNTGFNRCKAEYGEPNLACRVNGYTIYRARLAPGATTSCDVAWVSSLPLNSHIATNMPPTSPINCLIDFLFSNQCSGSKSPSRAPATLTAIVPGNTLRKMYRVRRV